MGDFRKVVIALAALLMFVGVAAAQGPLTCSASVSVPPTIRTEGYTELVGDIVLACSGGGVATAGTVSTNSLANITVFTTAPITSRVYATPSVINGAPSEALLLVDEPVPAGTVGGTAPVQSLCSTPANGAAGCSATVGATGTVTVNNVYQGIVNGSFSSGSVTSQSVTFFGVPLLPPATAGGTRIYRITNIRVSGGSVSGSGGFPGQVQASVSIAGGVPVQVNQPTQVVALGQASLATAIRTTALTGTQFSTALTIPEGLAQCTSLNDASSGNRAARGVLQFTENFGSAFKTRYTNALATSVGVSPTTQSIPGQVNTNSESGFVFPALGGTTATAGLADSGTRLKAVFNNVPNGVRVYVSYSNVVSGTAPATAATAASVATSYAQLVATTLAGEALSDISGLPSIATSGDTIGTGSTSTISAVELPVVNGQAVAVWEVINSQPFFVESMNFFYTLRFTASTATNSPAPGVGTVNLSYAPTANLVATTAANTTAPIPRFADTSTANRVFQIGACRSVLLFPYVANVQGLDTGLAISNTSTDPFGTTPQSGTCTLNAYGTNAPTQAINTAAVASGSYTTVLASSQLPGFVGYIIATCNFQYAHGFAFISDLGIRNLAMGYLALVIPDPGTSGGGRSSNDFAHNNPNSSEILGY